MTTYLEKYGPNLIEGGYKIVPIKRGTKAPMGIGRWPNIVADLNKLEKWISTKNLELEGVGILCKNNPAVDIDVLDSEVSRQMVDAVLQQCPGGLERVGKAPKTLLAYRTDKPFKKVRSSTYKCSSGKSHAVEILADKQQYVSFAIHPDTNKPYEWRGKSIADVNSDDLPIIRHDDAIKIVEIFEKIAQEKVENGEWEKTQNGTSGTSTEANNRVNGSDSTELADISNLKPTLDITDQEVKADLASLSADEYDHWVKVGMALYHQYQGSPEGLTIWDDWSQTSTNYTDERSLTERWSGFAPRGDRKIITFATIRRWANEAKNNNEFKISTRPISISFLDVQKKLGPINWLVKDFIEQDTVGLFFGDPGSYKSFLALDIAYHCATGKNWHGCKVVKGPVYYIAGEGHGGLARRQEAWFKHHKPDLSDMHFRFTTGPMDFYSSESAMLIARDIEEWAETAGNPVLIVIDTLARNFNGDENSASEMGKFINNVNDYIRASFECVVLIVHHTGHGEKKRARGSMALKAGIDFEYRVEKSKSNPLGLELNCTKMKDAVESGKICFEGKELILNFPEEGEEVMTSLVFEKADVVEEEKSLPPKLAKFLERVNSLVDPEGIVDRVHLRERAVAEELAKDAVQVRGYIRSLKKKNMIETLEAPKRIRLLDFP
jgi:hypothetical protein|tara:strand:+ start:2344 stop:4335 length:1992 start_codon:yes stop_codon:yes gene_type:complete